MGNRARFNYHDVILELIDEKPRSVRDLAYALEMSCSTVKRYLSDLQREGLIQSVREFEDSRLIIYVLK